MRYRERSTRTIWAQSTQDSHNLPLYELHLTFIHSQQPIAGWSTNKKVCFNAQKINVNVLSQRLLTVANESQIVQCNWFSISHTGVSLCLEILVNLPSDAYAAAHLIPEASERYYWLSEGPSNTKPWINDGMMGRLQCITNAVCGAELVAWWVKYIKYWHWPNEFVHGKTVIRNKDSSTWVISSVCN